MKKPYEAARLEVVMYDQTEILAASAVTPETPVTTTTYNREDDETEIL